MAERTIPYPGTQTLSYPGKSCHPAGWFRKQVETKRIRLLKRGNGPRRPFCCSGSEFLYARRRCPHMPKRATHTFESEKDGVQSEQLNQCFCLCCGESVLILGPRGGPDRPRLALPYPKQVFQEAGGMVSRWVGRQPYHTPEEKVGTLSAGLAWIFPPSNSHPRTWRGFCPQSPHGNT